MPYTPNAVNQYTTVNGISLTYDANGNLTNDGTNSFTYNTENHLLTAVISGNTQTYSYDPLGRRKQKVATGTFAGTTSFLHDGNQEIAEYNATGTLLRRYVFGPGIDEPIATIDAAGTRTYHHQDGLGSVIALSNGGNGNLVTAFAHGPYGETPNPGGTAFRYTGRRIDPETGLYYYRARYYSPNLGRFMQNDPIGYQGGLNLYAYVGNSPINFTDPQGLWCIPCVFAGAGAAIGVVVQAAGDFRNGQVSSIATYMGAGISGAVSGYALLVPGGIGVAASVGAAGGLAGNSFQQSVDIALGNQTTGYSATSAIAATISGVVSGGAGKAFTGVIATEYGQVSQRLITQYNNGTVSQASAQTLNRMVQTEVIEQHAITSAQFGDWLNDQLKENLPVLNIGGLGGVPSGSGGATQILK